MQNPLHQAKAFAPATVANVGPGFDVLGFAIEGPGDVVTATRIPEREIRIAEITGDGGVLSLAVDQNTAGMAARAVWESVQPDFGIELRIEKGMALGSGMGSSAASAVAAAVAVSRLLGDPLDQAALLRCCWEGERVASGAEPHYDNLAAALLGGLVRVRDSVVPTVERIEPLPAWHVALVHPAIVVRTSDARAAIPPDVLRGAVRSLAPAVETLIAAIRAADIALAGAALMRDDVISPFRRPLIKGHDAVIEAALAAGAAGVAISGSGPSMFAIAEDPERARSAGAAMAAAWRELGIGSEVRVSGIGAKGARVL